MDHAGRPQQRSAAGRLAGSHTTYRGWNVYSLPPPAGGWAVQQILNLLELAPEEDLSMDSDKRLIWLAEILRIGHRNRRLVSLSGFHQQKGVVLDQIAKEKAKQSLRTLSSPRGETTHFSVVDASGMAVGVTQSVNSYLGARIAHPEFGFLYNDYMKEFELNQPDHPFALRPQAVPYSSMSATVVSRSGEVGLVLGSPGSARIISAVMQVLSHWVDMKKGIIGEHAVPPDSCWLAALDSTLAYIVSNDDVLLSFQWWAAGPRWNPAYPISIEPLVGEDGEFIDKPQMAIIESYTRYPAPTIISITPSRGGRSSFLNLTVSGSNFIKDATTINFGSGIFVRSLALRGHYEMLVNIGIGPGATVGACNVSITTEGPGGGTATLVNAFTVTNDAPTSVEQISSNTPDDYILEQNYPNPFNPTTVIEFTLARQGDVKVTLFNSIGKEVAVLLDEHRSAGSHRLVVDAANWPSGVYLYRVTASGRSKIGKVVLLR